MKTDKDKYLPEQSKYPYERINRNEPKGKILRVKHGYNPNSSSMGSIIFAMPVALLGISIGFGAVSGIIAAAFMKHSEKKDMQYDQTPSAPIIKKKHTEQRIKENNQ